MKSYTGFLSVFLLFLFFSCSDGNTPAISDQYQAKSEKRGVAYNFQIPNDANLLGSGVQWFYNWGTTVSDTVNATTRKNDIDYFPMAWNGNYNSDQIRAYKLVHPECEYLLAFNEPNLTDQANMTPQQAAALWPDLKELATELDLKIISPAMNYGTLAGYSDPIVWLDEFFSLIPESDISGIAIHCYMANPASVVWYINRFKKYNKPIWLTEFCGWESGIRSASDQMKYMSDVVNYLECDTTVSHYAWFIPRTSGSVDSYPYMQLLTKTLPYDLTDLGKVYVGMSSFDNSVYYPQGQQIPAEHYVALNSSESSKSGIFANTIRVRPTTDVDGDLEVYNFVTGYWVEYQIQTSGDTGKNLNVRYSSSIDASVAISVDGTELKTETLAATGSDTSWTTKTLSVHIKSGKHTIRFAVTSGSLNLNWFSVTEQ